MHLSAKDDTEKKTVKSQYRIQNLDSSLGLTLLILKIHVTVCLRVLKESLYIDHLVGTKIAKERKLR